MLIGSYVKYYADVIVLLRLTQKLFTVFLPTFILQLGRHIGWSGLNGSALDDDVFFF